MRIIGIGILAVGGDKYLTLYLSVIIFISSVILNISSRKEIPWNELGTLYNLFMTHIYDSYDSYYN